MATGTQRGYDAANYYVWRAPGGYSIHLNLTIVRELAAQIAASGETRGLLLGRATVTPFGATIADEFVVIPPLEDFASARRAVENNRRGLCAIGYFRSQHDGPLRLDARDLQTFDRLFYENGNLALLIRTPRRGDSEAALFYWQDNRAQLREFGFGFPFDAAKLAGGPVAPSESIRWLRLLPTATLVITGIIATQIAWNSRGPAPVDSVPPAEATGPATVAADETSLGLSVTSEPHQLEIRWNRVASAVTAAAQGTMSISEAGVTKDIPFDARELREGHVAYAPKTNDVNIRFEVTAADGRATRESIRVVAIP